jgi:AbrB family transcriptional regulator (stage V sporulation protein T)
VEKIMEERNPVLESPNGQVSFVDSNDEEVQSYTAAPIIASGDPIGAVLIFSKDSTIGEVEQKSVETAASFLARQMEQ